MPIRTSLQLTIITRPDDGTPTRSLIQHLFGQPNEKAVNVVEEVVSSSTIGVGGEISEVLDFAIYSNTEEDFSKLEQVVVDKGGCDIQGGLIAFRAQDTDSISRSIPDASSSNPILSKYLISGGL